MGSSNINLSLHKSFLTKKLIDANQLREVVMSASRPTIVFKQKLSFQKERRPICCAVFKISEKIYKFVIVENCL